MFLERAAKAQSQSSFDVALYYFANAVKVNPQEIAIHEAMYACGKSFCMGGGKPASGVDVKSLDGPTPQDRLAVAELYWMRDLKNVARCGQGGSNWIRRLDWAESVQSAFCFLSRQAK